MIFLSGANDLDVRLQGLRLGAVDYISKPFSPEEVIARVGIHLDLHRRLREPVLAAGEAAAASAAALPVAMNSTVRAAMDILQRDPANPPSLQAASPASPVEAPVTQPSAAPMQSLHEAAVEGRISDIEDSVQQILEREPGAAAFARKVREAVRRQDLAGIIKMTN